MIEAPHPLHTHRRSTLYIYNVFPHLILQLQVIRMQPPTWYMLGLTVKVVVVGDFLQYVMIEAPHTLYTHSRSSSYIYIVFPHLILRLQVIIRMQPQPDICLVSQSKVVVGDSPGFAMGLHCYISLRHLTHFILIAGLLHTYIMCFSTFYFGWHPYLCNHTLLSSLDSGLTVPGHSVDFDLYILNCYLQHAAAHSVW
jgi:hypothetical protein